MNGLRAVFAFALLLAPVGLAAQPPSSATPPADPIPTLRSQSNLVLVDVVVSGHNRDVAGLAREKFHLFEDGKPQPLTVFEEHDPVAAEPSATAAAGPAGLGPNVYTNVPSLQRGVDNVLLLDTLNTPIEDQTFVRQQILKYLRNIPPGTRLAVFTLASRLRMVSGFETDPAALSQALNAKGVIEKSVLLDPAFENDLAAQFNGLNAMGATANSLASVGQFLADQAAYQTDQRVLITLDALQQLARYLEPFPGRKNLIWFSGSFPLGFDADPSLISPFRALRDYSELLRAVDARLSAARVAVYPVDARGILLAPSSTAANDYGSKSLAAASATGGGSPGVNSTANTAGRAAQLADDKALVQSMQEHNGDQQIAQETGGLALVQTNDLAQAIRIASTHGELYYTVGYVPSAKRDDGAFHKLKIVVDGEPEPAYRHGYYAVGKQPPPAPAPSGPLRLDQASTADRNSVNLMRNAVQPNSPPMSEVLFKVRVQPAPAAAAQAAPTRPGLQPYQLDYLVPAHRLRFEAGPDGTRHGHLEFTVVAYDGAGKRLNFVDQNAPVDLSAAVYRKILESGLVMHQLLDLPAGPVFLRIVVHDIDANRAGAIEVPVLVVAAK